MTDFVKVCPLEAVPEHGNKAFDINGKSILVCRSAGHVYAVVNVCSHQSLPLEGGRCRGHYLFCPVHGARFDLRDGSTMGTLTKMPIATFPARVHEGQIEVAVG